ncbi:unknown protein [Seminavis robusta]|uniref:Fungal lipase-type domain-containing protein n=1 Tax=Seminavis robusta TaxID=568900 RepID=A0A9N8HQD5_9STRA|nr:unknown protein [Seminavis robusta]|eukprot:Sro1430_g271990.1 n/a (236) ;mRNA; f:27769-28761
MLTYKPNSTDTEVATKAADEMELEYIKAFRAAPDLSLVALDKGTKECFGVFRGTHAGIGDLLQNFDLEETMVEGCKCHNSYVSAVHNSYFPEFDAALHDCLQKDCPDCTLTLTGHSQGGAVDENHYRLANMIPTPMGVIYDMVAMLPGMGAEHFGHSILLGGDKMAAYLGKHEGHIRFHWGISPHDMKYYIGNLEKLISTIREEKQARNIDLSSGTVDMRRYKDGSRCRYNGTLS